MAEPSMRPVYSESVERIGYDHESQELWVTWKRSGKTSVYEGVPADVAEQVSSAWSVGKAVASMIKDQYGHRYA